MGLFCLMRFTCLKYFKCIAMRAGPINVMKNFITGTIFRRTKVFNEISVSKSESVIRALQMNGSRNLI